MPKFIKMGLGGTGFLGKKESSLRSKRKYAQRRRVLEGFPVTRKFESRAEVLEYFSGDKVVCLLCGHEFGSLGQHIRKLHELDPDQYREKYGIPWTYGLTSQRSSAKYSNAVTARMEAGWDPSNPNIAGMAANARLSPVKSEIGKMNLGKHAKPKYQLSIGPDGQLHTKSDLRLMAQTKRGTPEFAQKMKDRKYSEEVRSRFANWWKGKKQSAEHKAARFKRA